jgi:NTP pyrophosphatase (non-canonical NTP hydrolase)
MHLNEYQFAASTFRSANAPNSEREAGLVEEVGEIFGVIKRMRRNDYPVEEAKAKLSKEFGDALWYLVSMMEDWGFQLEDIAKINLDKLTDRRERKVLKGSGDSR